MSNVTPIDGPARQRHPTSRPDLSTDSIFDLLADAGAARVEVRRLGRLWTASTLILGRRRVCEGYSAHTALRRLYGAVSGDPGGAA